MEQFTYHLTPDQTRSNRLAMFALLVLVLSSVGLDQVTKIHAQNTMMVWSHETDPEQYRGSRYPVAMLGDEAAGKPFIALGINYVRNQGAAWGMLANSHSNFRVPFFYAVTVLAVVILIFYFRATPPSHRLARFALAMIFSGAIGNFIDRLRFGFVIDWIDVHWNILGWRYFFPNFNAADSAISCGVFLLLFDMIFLEPSRRKKFAHLNPQPS